MKPESVRLTMDCTTGFPFCLYLIPCAKWRKTINGRKRRRKASQIDTLSSFYTAGVSKVLMRYKEMVKVRHPLPVGRMHQTGPSRASCPHGCGTSPPDAPHSIRQACSPAGRICFSRVKCLPDSGVSPSILLEKRQKMAAGFAKKAKNTPCILPCRRLK